MGNEYKEHMKSDGAMFSAALSGLVGKNSLPSDKGPEIAYDVLTITSGDVTLEAKRIREVAIEPERFRVSFFAGDELLKKSQLLYGFPCSVTYGSLDVPEFSCSLWECNYESKFVVMEFRSLKEILL